MKILLAEDYKSQRRVMTRMLHQLGYADVVGAADGQDAWRLLNEDDFDLLITDCEMPNMSGIELAERVRATPSLTGLPILMVTALNDQKNLVRAKRAGATDYLVKPFPPTQLVEKLKTTFAGVRRQMAHKAEDILHNGVQHFPQAGGAPYLLVLLEQGSEKRLAAGLDKELFNFIKHISELIDRLNRRHPGLNLGYCIDEKADVISSRLRSPTENTRMLLTWITPDHAQMGFTIARMAGQNTDKRFRICVFCEQTTALPPSDPVRLAAANVALLENSEADLQAFEHLLCDLLADDLADQKAKPQ